MGTESKKVWRKRARTYLAAAFGGKCTICGYDKTIAALDYHHVNKDEKDHELSKAMRNGHAWTKIVVEARKCTIVCCRCHREIHAGITTLPQDYARFNEEYVDIIKLKLKEFDECPICGVEKYRKLKYCSVKCVAESQKRFDISKEELEALIKTSPFEKIGEIYGVSGNAVKKRCKVLGIRTEIKRGYWSGKRRKNLDISSDELKRLLAFNSITKLAKEFGTTNEIIKRKIEDYGLITPTINWNKLNAIAQHAKNRETR